ncbi:MAG: MarR family winged helix-turn-helix transcriptional regulator [Gemmatirosa sp.]
MTTSSQPHSAPILPDVTPAERDALRLWVVLSRAHAAIAAHAAADVARHGLTLAEFGVLEALHHKGPMLLGEVQRSLLVSSGGVTYLVDRLEQRGLVRRDRCPEDRRARYAVLTDAGTAFVREAFPRHAAAVQTAMAGLTQAEQETVRGLLRTLGTAAAEKASTETTSSGTASSGTASSGEARSGTAEPCG